MVESKTTPEELYEVIAGMLSDTVQRQKMAEAAGKLAGDDAARRVAEEIEASCNRN